MSGLESQNVASLSNEWVGVCKCRASYQMSGLESENVASLSNLAFDLMTSSDQVH